MIDLSKYDDVRIVKVEDVKNITLDEDEYLLKVAQDNAGFMVKKTKDGLMPSIFDSWRNNWYIQNTPMTIYIIKEKFRRDWKFRGLRHGQSTAWVVLQHPYGFEVEINSTAFEEISKDITMVNGRMITPCYFQAKLKNAKLIIKKDDGQDFFYTLLQAVSDDKRLIGKLQDIVTDERPDRFYEVISRSR